MCYLKYIPAEKIFVRYYYQHQKCAVHPCNSISRQHLIDNQSARKYFQIGHFTAEWYIFIYQ